MIIFLIVGIPFVLFGLYFIVNTYNFRKFAAQVDGKVLGYEKEVSRSRQRGSSTTYSPVIEFVLGVETYRFKAGMSSSNMSHQIGETVPVYYKTNDPHEAQIKSSLRYIFGGVFLAMGAVAVTIGAINIELGLETLGFGALILGSIAFKFFQVKARANAKGIYTMAEYIAAGKGDEASLDRGLYGTEGKNYQPSENFITESDAVVKNQTIPAWGIAIILLIAVGALGGTVYTTKQQQEFLQSASKTLGTVTGFDSSTSDGTTTYRPIVRYQFSGGSDVTFTSSWGSSNPSESKGDKVLVIFDPDNKRSAQLDKGIFNWIIPGIFGFVALMFFYSGFYSIKKRKQHGI